MTGEPLFILFTDKACKAQRRRKAARELKPLKTGQKAASNQPEIGRSSGSIQPHRQRRTDIAAAYTRRATQPSNPRPGACRLHAEAHQLPCLVPHQLPPPGKVSVQQRVALKDKGAVVPITGLAKTARRSLGSSRGFDI
jgi:hypothetical protein